MMASAAKPMRPPTVLRDDDHMRLVALASVALRRSLLLACMLLKETDRAEVVTAERLPSHSVALGSRVEFRDEATVETRWVRMLAWHADRAEGSISDLSLLGAGLISLSEGDSIEWPRQDGRLRRLTVLRVEKRCA